MKRNVQAVGLLLMAGILAIGGCATHKAPEPAPPAVSLVHFAGSPLSAPEAKAQQVSASESLAVDFRAYLLPVVPKGVLKPFAAESRVITSAGMEAPLMALPSTLAGARMDSGEAAAWIENEVRGGTYGKARDLGEYHAALPPGVSGRVTVAAEDAEQRQLQLAVYRPEAATAGLRVGLTRQGPAEKAHAAGGNQPQAAPETRTVREMALADLGKDQRIPLELAVLVPVDFASNSQQAVLFMVRISPPSQDATHVKAAEQAQRDLAGEGQRAQGPSFEQLLVQSVMRSAEVPETRRPALIYLATQTQATILRDVAMVADDATLQTLVNELKPRLDTNHVKGSLSALTWTLDRTAFDVMGKLMMQRKLSPALNGVLAVHAGEAAYSVASMEQLVGKAANPHDLENRLVAENYIFLEDMSPAARVRAYDWLKARGKSPQNYDPLGPAEQRQKALEAAIEQMSHPAATGPTTMATGGGK